MAQPESPTKPRHSQVQQVQALVQRYPIFLSAILHVVLIAYGEYQDRNFTVKYTDIDYRVFSDAVNHLWTGGSKDGMRAKGWLTRTMGWSIGE